MTPEAKRRKNQKKKLKQKQKKAAAVAAAAAVSATASADTGVTDVLTVTADADSMITENNTLDLTSNTVSDEANMNTGSDLSLDKDNIIQEEKGETTILDHKEEGEDLKDGSQRAAKVVEESLSEVELRQLTSDEDVQKQEVDQHNEVNEVTSQAGDEESLNKYNEEVVKGNDLSEEPTDINNSENKLVQQSDDLDEIINKPEEVQSETNIEIREDKEIGQVTSAKDELTQNENQFVKSVATDTKNNESLSTHIVLQIEDVAPQEEEEEEEIQTQENWQQSSVVNLNNENVESPTMINAKDLSTNSGANQNDKLDLSHEEIALGQHESFSKNHFTEQESTNEDIFESSLRDELLSWKQQENVHQNEEKSSLQNHTDEHTEKELEPAGELDDLFGNENNEEFLPWIETNTNKETEISNNVIDHTVNSNNDSVILTNYNEHENLQTDNDIRQMDNTPGLFGKDIDQHDKIRLHEAIDNVPSSPVTSVTPTVEPGSDSSTKIKPEHSQSTVNDSFKKFSFLKDDDDLLDDDDDSFLESEDELVIQNDNGSESVISSEGIILDNTSRNNSKRHFHTTSKYTPNDSDMIISNQNTLPTQSGTVGIVLPQQINNISESAFNIQPSQSSTIQLPNQDLIRPSMSSQNAQNVIEKLAVEKKKSDAYDFPMDLSVDKVKPVHAKPVGVPSPVLNNTSFLPKKSSRNASISIRSTSGYQSLDAVSNIPMPVNPYASIAKKETTSKQLSPPTGPIGVGPPSINFSISPTSSISNNNMTSSTNAPPLQGNVRNFSNKTSTPIVHPNTKPSIYAPQTGVNTAPPKKTSQSSQYTPQSSTVLQPTQALPSQYSFPTSNANPPRSISISPVNTNLNYTSSASRGNHARKNSSLYSPNSNEISSRYAPTVHPQYQHQLETIQSDSIPQQFPAAHTYPKPTTIKKTVPQVNSFGISHQYPSRPINNNETLEKTKATSQQDSYVNCQVSDMGLSQSVNGEGYNNKQLGYQSNKVISEVDNNTLLSRQFPLFQFSSSSKIVYGIPVSMGGYGTTTSVVNSLKIINLDSIVKPDPILKSFPGPLIQKTKRKDVEKWLSTIIEEINLDTSSDEYLVWKILQIKLSDSYSTDDISEAIYDTSELQKYLSQPFNLNFSQPNAYRLDNIGQMRVLASLQVGDHNAALQNALVHKDYTMALLIGSLISKDKWVDVVDSYFAEEVNNPTCVNLLSLIFQAFMGNSKTTIEKFYSNNEKAAWLLDNWRTVVAAVLKHCNDYDNTNKIPPVIIEFFVELAIFLYHKGHKHVASVLFMIVDIPLTTIPVLRDSDVTFTYIGNPTSVQSIVWSELYQYYCVTQNSKLSNYDELLLQKIYHGMCLQEQGLPNLATKYSDYVASRLKQLNKKDVISLNLSSKLEELQSRLVGSNSGWLLKPKLSSVWGQLDKSFNKYIGGDEDTSPTPSDTFGKYMVGNEEIIKSSPSNVFNNYVGGNLETSSAAVGISKTTSRPIVYSPKKHSLVKKPIERSPYIPMSQTLSTSNVLEGIKSSPVKSTMYSLQTNNSVPVNLSNHFNSMELTKQNDHEIPTSMVSKTGNEPLEELSVPTLQPKEADVADSLIEDVPTELQSAQYPIPLPVDNSDASLLANSDIAEISKDQRNILYHQTNDLPQQEVENMSLGNPVVDIDNSQLLKNDSVEISIQENETSLPPVSESNSLPTDAKMFSSNAIRDDLSYSMENDIEPVTEACKETVSAFTTHTTSDSVENSVIPSPGTLTATSIQAEENDLPPPPPQGSTSIPLVQVPAAETMNESVKHKPSFDSTDYNNDTVAGMGLNNIDSFEPRIRPSSSVVQGIPSVKTSEEVNVQYNDEVEDDSTEDEDEETVDTKMDIETKRKEEKSNTSVQKGGWFSWLKKDPNEKKVVKAKLGHQNNFYYDEKLKRWINKDATEEEKKKMQESMAPPPPPIVKRKNTAVKTTPRPSFSHPNTNPVSSAPSDPPLSTILPVNPLSGQPIIQTSNNISTSTSAEGSITPKLPPSINGNKPINLAGKTSNGLDDILNISAGTTVSRRKKKPGRGYVNVMENR